MATVHELLGGTRPLVKFDAYKTCPKCGADDLWRQYHRSTHEPGCDLSEFEPRCCKFEHHCRGCRACSFEWCERLPAKRSAEVTA